jgi:hypothetical protein
MKKKERKGLPLNEKIRKCEEIKNRYLKSKEKSQRKNESSSSGEEEEEEEGSSSEYQGEPLK